MCNQCIKKLAGAPPDLFGVKYRFANDMSKRDFISKFIGKCPAMKMLEGLTPSGSEFWEDPQRCYEMLKEQRSSTHKLLVESIKERNIALARIVVLEKEAGRGRGKETASSGEPGHNQSESSGS